VNYAYGDWTFQREDIARDFDAHVREQLPWYDLATGAVAHIARHYIPEGGLVYDIGASTGNIGRSLAETLVTRNARLVAIEASAEMVRQYQGPGEIVQADALTFPFEEFDVAIVFLVLMFLPPGRRKGFLRDLCAKIRPGGALIIFDKVTGPSGYLSTVLHRLTIAGKVATGATPAEIIAKELSLIGVQRPLGARFMELAVSPMPTEVFPFGEFVGWVIENPE
jgi:tRNA (cmo5U34)-methyltransferase